MTFLAYVDSFNIGTGAPASTVVRTGYGFQPKVAIFFTTGDPTASPTDAVSAGSLRPAIGVAVSPTSRWVAMSRGRDGVASSETDCMVRTDCCFGALLLGGGAPEGLADLQSFDADGLTVVIDDQFVASYRVTVLALGGTDITDLSAGTLTEPGATGDQDTTAPGFQPDFALLAGTHATALDTLTAASLLSIGAVAGATPENAVHSGASNDAANSNTMSYSRTVDECVALFNAGATALDARAKLTAWLSTGFRLNWAARASTRIVPYLVIKGGSYKIGQFLTQTSTGTFVESGVGFEPKAGLFVSHALAESAAATPTSEDRISIGAASSATRRETHAGIQEDTGGVTALTRAVQQDEIYANLSLSSAIQGSVDILSVDADGWTLDQDDADPAAALVWYVAFGAGGAAGPTWRPRGATQRMRQLGPILAR